MDGLIKQLAETGGVAWLLLAICFVAIAFLFNVCRTDTKERINDLKEFNSKLLEPITAIKNTVDLILNSIKTK